MPQEMKIIFLPSAGTEILFFFTAGTRSTTASRNTAAAAFTSRMSLLRSTHTTARAPARAVRDRAESLSKSHHKTSITSTTGTRVVSTDSADIL